MLEFNTIGVQLKYAVEASKGAGKPASGYTKIPNIKTIPGMDFAPSQLDVTDLEDKYRRYIPGVIDAGNDLAVVANLTADLKSKWASLVSAAKTAWNSGIMTYFEVAIPNFESFYFAGLPQDQGLPEAGVDAVMETTLHIIPNKVEGWGTASTT